MKLICHDHPISLLAWIPKMFFPRWQKKNICLPVEYPPIKYTTIHQKRKTPKNTNTKEGLEGVTEISQIVEYEKVDWQKRKKRRGLRRNLSVCWDKRSKHHAFLCFVFRCVPPDQPFLYFGKTVSIIRRLWYLHSEKWHVLHFTFANQKNSCSFFCGEYQ